MDADRISSVGFVCVKSGLFHTATSDAVLRLSGKRVRRQIRNAPGPFMDMRAWTASVMFETTSQQPRPSLV